MSYYSERRKFYVTLRPKLTCQEPGCRKAACRHELDGVIYIYCPKHLGLAALTLQHFHHAQHIQRGNEE